MSTVISVENISKLYRLGSIGGATLKEDFARWWAKRRGRPDPLQRVGEEHLARHMGDEFWALRDVSFQVKEGEVLGVIGRNGAGKSTLLKILSQVTSPTSGEIKIKGRIASLLEVGTGFHPELTGRENVFLNGAILGMTRAEVRQKFDEIVAFSGIEEFIDTPVKRYSSGMYVRLAFAVAAHLEPEILIVDEVLAVGDAEFQRKCMGKMSAVARGGRTILFVSHNMQAISTLTNRCLLLADGVCKFDGSTSSATAAYLKTFKSHKSVFVGEASLSVPRITRIEITTSKTDSVQICGDPLQVSFEINAPSKVRGACLSFQLLDDQQRPVVHLWTFDSEQPMCREPGIYKIVCVVPKLRLYMGSYTMNVYFSEPPGGEMFQFLEHVCPFEVHMFGQHREFEWKSGTCAYLEESSWKIAKVAASSNRTLLPVDEHFVQSESNQ